MAKKFQTPIAPPSLSSDPAAGVMGSIYYNTEINALKYYDGAAWRPISSGGGGGGGTSVEIDSAYYNQPEDGVLLYNTTTNNLAVSYENVWRELAYRTQFDSPIDGGDSSTQESEWDLILDGGESDNNSFLNAYY